MPTALRYSLKLTFPQTAKEVLPMARRARKAEKTNGCDPKKLSDALGALHDLTDQMEASGARFRGKINKVYEARCEELGVTKKALMKDFRRERRDRNDQDWARTKADAQDREGFLRMAAAYGDDTPMGRYCTYMASCIPDERPEGAEDGGEDQSL